MRVPADLQEERGLKQYEFAKLLGRSPSWYSQILNGRRRLGPELAVEIAHRLSLGPRGRDRLLSLVEREMGASRLARLPWPDQQLVWAGEYPDEWTATMESVLEACDLGAEMVLTECSEPPCVAVFRGADGATLSPRPQGAR